jgi:hypothetical protein
MRSSNTAPQSWITPADSIKAKLKRGTFAATFFLACLAALELEGVVLEEI